MSVYCLEDVADEQLGFLLEAGCCTSCAEFVRDGSAIQSVDANGRLHRHCWGCHSKHINSTLTPSAGGTCPAVAGRRDSFETNPARPSLSGLSPEHGNDHRRPLARAGGVGRARRTA